MPASNKKPGMLDRARDNLLYDFGLNQNTDIKKYLEYKRLKYNQGTLTAAFNQLFYELIRNDAEYQMFIKNGCPTK
jgi:hypothetical protein